MSISPSYLRWWYVIKENLAPYFFLESRHQKLGSVMATLTAKFTLTVLAIIFFLHQALLIADLASEKYWPFWTWVLYFVSAIVTFFLLFIISDIHWLVLAWVVFHGITTLASAIAYYTSGNNTSNLVPSLKLGQMLAFLIPMPAKDLSIIGTTVILMLVSILFIGNFRSIKDC